MGNIPHKKGNPSKLPREDVLVIANQLSRIMKLRNSSAGGQFRPDHTALEKVLMRMDNLTVRQMINYTKSPNQVVFPHGFEVLLSFANILEYDSYSRSVVQSIHKLVFKNDSKLSPNEIMQYLVTYILCIHGGPLLSSNAEGAIPKMPDPADMVGVFNTMVILDNMLKDSSPLFAKGIDVDLLRFSIESFSPDKRAVMKMLVGLPVSSKEKHAFNRSNYQLPKTQTELARFKECELFDKYAAWAVTTLLIFPGLKLGAGIDYQALLKGLDTLIRNNFTAKRIRKKVVHTLFSGTRELDEVRITRAQWEFTDPEEAKMLQQYLSQNISTLMGDANT